MTELRTSPGGADDFRGLSRGVLLAMGTLIYTDGYLNSLVKVPTVYEKMRNREPNILIWVALHQLYSGADRMLFATGTVLAKALEEGLVEAAEFATLQGEKPDRRKFEMLDEDVIE